MESQAKRDVFAITGLTPEVLAVAMAKYSRSKNSIRDTIDELTEEKSAQFHEKWVLGYGDASVADMAIIAIACENVSIIASKAIEDTRLASFQEKSTRYVDFDSSKYHRPKAAMMRHAELYEKTVNHLFTMYNTLLEKMIPYLRKRIPRPADTTDKLYEAKLKARSLDAVRYLLPVATLTNFGMIMSARSLRHLISKLKGNAYEEVRELAEEIQAAALEPAYNPQIKKLQEPLEALKSMGTVTANIAEQITSIASLQVKGAPTLIKHTEASQYHAETQVYLNSIATELLGSAAIEDAPRVDYLEEHSYEDELITTLVYSACSYPYRQILARVQPLTQEKKQEILDALAKLRGTFDYPRREYEIGGQFVFDILMDYGAFRDLQRHRICTQINQPLTTQHGYEVPFEFRDAGLEHEFTAAIDEALKVHAMISKNIGTEADYLIPLACKKRTLFKMNLRELHHMVELRSKPGGHMSYRTVVVDMLDAVQKRHPLLGKHVRVSKLNYDEDFFKR
ncbi:MAG: FAD-dependent thymidylate synthase [Patescibacteria group bacterium]|jgi:thymidylate synthase ThyX